MNTARFMRLLGTIAASLLALPACAAAPPPALERVSFSSIDVDGTGRVVTLQALLYRPAGSEGKRIPAVVALHGCGGMYSVLKTRRNDLSLRHYRMAELLTGEGYAVLFPDSMRPRGVEEICTQLNSQRTIHPANRRLDALAALAYLQQRPDILADRVALLGWSHGGSTLLSTMNAKSLPVQHFREDAHAPFFRGAVGFYPGCVDSLQARTGYATAAPMLLLVGASDDWTAAKPCERLVERMQQAAEPADIVVYPDTYHGFDGPSAQPRVRLEVPNGVHPGKGVTVAVNAVAREDAYVRVKAFMHRVLDDAALDRR